MKNILTQTLQVLFILIAIPLIFLTIFKFGTPWVSTNYDSTISDFSRDSSGVAKFIEKTTGFDITNNQEVIRKNKLDSIDALKNSFSLFMHSFFCASLIIITIVWIPILGILKGFYLGSFEIIGNYVMQGIIISGTIIATGFGAFYILSLWLGTLFTETYTPGFFLVWSTLGLLSIPLGIYGGIAPYVLSMHKMHNTLITIFTNYIIGGFVIFIAFILFKLIRDAFYFF